MVNVREKGKRAEYEIKDKLLNANIQAKRVPLSGSGSLKGDIIFILDDKSYTGEVKVRQNAFNQIYKLISEYDLNMNGIKITTFERWLMKEKRECVDCREFRMIRNWLVDRDILFFKSNYKEWLVAYYDQV